MCFDNTPIELAGAFWNNFSRHATSRVGLSKAGKAIFGQAATLVQPKVEPEFLEDGSVDPSAGQLYTRQLDIKDKDKL